jgi:hypothetical protein
MCDKKEDEMQIATCGECWCFNRDGWCTLIDERCDANDEACGRAMPIVADEAARAAAQIKEQNERE